MARRRPAGEAPERELTDAIACLDAPTPCGIPNPLWISEEPDDRARAAILCGPCPVLLPCRRVGEFHNFGVWGGIDRAHPGRTHTTTPNKETE